MKYKCIIHETTRSTVEVDANNADEAYEKAEQARCDGEEELEAIEDVSIDCTPTRLICPIEFSRTDTVVQDVLRIPWGWIEEQVPEPARDELVAGILEAATRAAQNLHGLWGVNFLYSEPDDVAVHWTVPALKADGTRESIEVDVRRYLAAQGKQ